VDGEDWANLVSAVDPQRSLDAAILLRRTGTPLAAWTRETVPLDVVSVMTATLVGSVETMVEAIHCASPRAIRVETDECRMVATRIDPKTILVLVASVEVRQGQVEQQARQLASQVASQTRDARRLVPAAAPPARA